MFLPSPQIVSELACVRICFPTSDLTSSAWRGSQFGGVGFGGVKPRAYLRYLHHIIRLQRHLIYPRCALPRQDNDLAVGFSLYLVESLDTRCVLLRMVHNNHSSILYFPSYKRDNTEDYKTVYYIEYYGLLNFYVLQIPERCLNS